ncbi:hypothetical protein GC163_00945 [bacterium]|nr:hypothetical protein [bacterium]
MNCQNCAAPLQWAPGSDVLKCQFCGSYRALAELANGVDAVVVLEEPTATPCPACDTELLTAAVDRIAAQVCPTCHGLLFASEAFAHLVRHRRAEYSGADRMPQPLDPDQLAGRVNCPHCKKPMDRHPYGGPGCQIIDCCTRCEIIWLDSGELAAIEAAPGRR